MKINLELSNAQIWHILRANGYVIEDVLVWYAPHDSEEINEDELKSYYTKFVYKRGEETPWKHEEKPLLENYERYLFDKMVGRIISDLLFKKLL